MLKTNCGDRLMEVLSYASPIWMDMLNEGSDCKITVVKLVRRLSANISYVLPLQLKTRVLWLF
jgi:hypothetical protein